MPKESAGPGARGAQTRIRAQQVALRLFTEQGYEATSLRQIAAELGINKASLYYYFDGKEAIVQSLLDQRGDEAEALLTWVRAQPPSPDLPTAAVLRWVDSFTAEKLQGIRFLAANPLLLAGPTRTNAGQLDLAVELLGDAATARGDDEVAVALSTASPLGNLVRAITHPDPERLRPSPPFDDEVAAWSALVTTFADALDWDSAR